MELKAVVWLYSCVKEVAKPYLTGASWFYFALDLNYVTTNLSHLYPDSFGPLDQRPGN